MQISVKRFLVIALAANGLIVEVACDRKKVERYRAEQSGGGETLPPEPGAPGLDRVASLSSSYGLLNFRQLTSTYSQLTGVTLANTLVEAEYNKQLGSLPRDFTVAQISAAKVSAAGKVAAQYCDILSANVVSKFPDLTNLAAGIPDATAFASTLLTGFYGPEASLQGDRAADVAAVAASVNNLKALGGSGPAIFMATCASVLSSAEFYLY